jgi:hypothetical protein
MQKCLWCTAIDETGIFRPPDAENHMMIRSWKNILQL